MDEIIEALAHCDSSIAGVRAERLCHLRCGPMCRDMPAIVQRLDSLLDARLRIMRERECESVWAASGPHEFSLG